MRSQPMKKLHLMYLLAFCGVTGCYADQTGIHDDDWGVLILFVLIISVLVALAVRFGPRSGDGADWGDSSDSWDDGGDGGD